ncbi:RICIN domain-containing protein [Streptomyces sp. MUM 136J]|uniref:RICIN domain-containing protein n=1 Tax=Streptomyces sp. MUM 136J TaxID=2791992 RepID=UPI0027E56D4E|nr:RICIN domain-containing protein [Streptomyces sp. MUM 136J]
MWPTSTIPSRRTQARPQSLLRTERSTSARSSPLLLRTTASVSNPSGPADVPSPPTSKTGWASTSACVHARGAPDPMAANDSLLLRAFRSLHPTAQAALCPELAETSVDATSASRAGTRSVSAVSARRQLSEAYVRSYAAEAPSRTCRHLTAVMDDAVRGSVSHRSQELDLHADVCRSCSRVRAELTVVQSATAVVLSKVLVDSASAAAVAAQAEDGDEDCPAPGEPTPGATASTGRTCAPGRARQLWALVAASPLRAAAVAGVTAAALTAAVVVIPRPFEDTRRPLARATAAPPGSALPTPTPSAVAPAGPSRPASPTSGPATPLPAPTAPANTSAPTTAAKAKAPATPAGRTPTRPPAGFQLVNRSTGLCVGVQSEAAGAALRLEDCNAGAWQRWESVEAGYGAYQIRNVGTNKCLDGTDGGGNVVRVVQSDCHDRRSAQLWIIEPQADAGAFRLQFVPPVPASDYSSHLFGPEDWWSENPPRRGSYLAQLPNYYNSESFVFVMNRSS